MGWVLSRILLRVPVVALVVHEVLHLQAPRAPTAARTLPQPALGGPDACALNPSMKREAFLNHQDW